MDVTCRFSMEKGMLVNKIFIKHFNKTIMFGRHENGKRTLQFSIFSFRF